MQLFWICAGGALGTGARALLSAWALRALGATFPWGTLAVNLVGSLLMGLLMQLALERPDFPPTLRLAATTGFLGGFTTYSTFNQDTLRALEAGDWGVAAANVGVTLAGALVAGALGMALGRTIAG